MERSFRTEEQVDFLGLAKDVHARRPKGIFIVAGALDSAMICQQLQKVGSQALVVLSEWGSTAEFTKAGGKAVAGVYALQHYDSASGDPAFRAFRDAYEKRFGDLPSFAAAYSYEAVLLIARALERDRDVRRIKDAVIGIGRFSGLQGSIEIDRFGDPSRAVSVMQVQGGRFVPQE
jgi:branched-chain amino acid transport system substrate-binding protein